MKRFALVGLALAMLALAGTEMACQRTDPAGGGAEAPAEPPWFEDVTEQRGLHFVHDPGPTGTYFMPQQVGSGAALCDFDGDGLLDIYLLQNAGPRSGVTNRLFCQLPGGRFEDVEGSGLNIDGWNMGVAVGDVNNDGRPDIVVTQYGGIRLFLNRGGRKFEDVTEKAGLSNPTWGTSVAFVDYDRDGWLDLVVVNYVDYDQTIPCYGPKGNREYCAPRNMRGRVTRLFRNLGPAGRFEDATEKSGLSRRTGPGLGVVCADFDGDGWPDIFIANDGKPNHLWINQRNGTFQEEAVDRALSVNGMGQTQAGMGIALGDVDGDGLFDLYVSHLGAEGNTLWRQGPRGFFQDRTTGAGLSSGVERGTGFGTLLADFDNDGALDLAVVNGRVAAAMEVKDWSLGPFWSWYGEPNQLFRNDGKGHFREISAHNAPFCGAINMGRGLAQGDIDGDGGVDLLVTSIGGPVRLFRNVAPGRGHWLRVRAFDPVLHRDALGSEVRVRAGGRTWVRWLHPAESYLCSSEPRAHFGLGAAERVEEIEVLWPDGSREAFAGCAADRPIEVQKGSGQKRSQGVKEAGKQ